MVPLVSFIAPANINEGDFLNSMIRYSKNELFLYIDIIVGDMGYISREKNAFKETIKYSCFNKGS